MHPSEIADFESFFNNADKRNIMRKNDLNHFKFNRK